MMYVLLSANYLVSELATLHAIPISMNYIIRLHQHGIFEDLCYLKSKAR
jgi:hypothetical protein